MAQLENALNIKTSNGDTSNGKATVVIIDALGKLGHIQSAKALVRVIDKKFVKSSKILRKFAISCLKKSPPDFVKLGTKIMKLFKLFAFICSGLNPIC